MVDSLLSLGLRIMYVMNSNALKYLKGKQEMYIELVIYFKKR